jgi:hypothetical protein
LPRVDDANARLWRAAALTQNAGELGQRGFLAFDVRERRFL